MTQWPPSAERALVDDRSGEAH